MSAFIDRLTFSFKPGGFEKFLITWGIVIVLELFAAAILRNFNFAGYWTPPVATIGWGILILWVLYKTAGDCYKRDGLQSSD
ncbi:hypothetical protein MYX07_06890 [Patescibacteria group bacterium AH-259-L07]|nr:hypothetical protein [Patescibacteria group bacterium AH-259-L07]